MSRLAYYRVSTADQSIEAQRRAMAGDGKTFDREFSDEGVSGATLAADRPGFAKLLAYVREGDSVHVYAIDRLGRDAIDVQKTVEGLLSRRVTVDVHGLGVIAPGVGELIVAVLAHVAAMERRRITERTAAGIVAAKEALRATGRTHKGATSLGRPSAQDAAAVVAWRKANEASISETAAHFGIGTTTVKRYIRASLMGAAGA